MPLDYDAFPVPLPPGAVRLGVIFFQVRRAESAGAGHGRLGELPGAMLLPPSRAPDPQRFEAWPA